MTTMMLPDTKVAELEATLDDLDDLGRYTLADAIRDGSKVTSQHLNGWTDGQSTACALSAAHLACRARHIL